jgi:hypothetical protein
MPLEKRILIICTDNYQKQPRVIRTIEALSTSYNIAVAGNSELKEHKIEFINLTKPVQKPTTLWHFNKPAFIRLPVSFYHKYVKQKQFYKPFFYEQSYWSESRKADLKLLQQNKYDLIISHGIDTLTLAIKLADHKIPVIFNAHEYYPLEFEQDKEWSRTEGSRSLYFINKYLPQCQHMFCVSKLIQDKFQTHVKINSTVITNAPNFIDLKPQQVDPNKIKIIHHGIALRERDIEHMATLIDYLDERFELNFMMTMPDKTYYEELEVKFKNNKRINFLPTVPLEQLVTFLNRFDIGYYILPPVNFNTKFALPNKLFEFIQARLCLAFGPSPEMKSIIEKYNLGVISDEFTPQSMADKLKTLSIEQINTFKTNAHKNAEELSSTGNQQKISQVIHNILNN